MESIYAILKHASKVTKEDQHELMSNLKKLYSSTCSFSIKVQERSFQFLPIDEAEARNLYFRSIGVRKGFTSSDVDKSKIIPTFAEYLMSLRFLTGAWNVSIDPYQVPFPQWFELSFLYGEQSYLYLFIVDVVDDKINFGLRKVVDDSDQRLFTTGYHASDPELAGLDQLSLRAHFEGYLEGISEVRRQLVIEPFVCHLPESFYVFGYSQQTYFQKKCKSYAKTMAEFYRTVKVIQAERQEYQEHSRAKKKK